MEREAPTRGARWRLDVKRRLALDVAPAVGPEVALEVGCMRVVTRARADDDAALPEPGVVGLGPILRNPGANQRADDAAGGAAGARAGKSRRDRASHHQAEARNDH